jgi:type II secretory pathway pseudopilin PulG
MNKQTSQCSSWIHAGKSRKCDLFLTEKQFKKYIEDDNLPYSCPSCKIDDVANCHENDEEELKPPPRSGVNEKSAHGNVKRTENPSKPYVPPHKRDNIDRPLYVKLPEETVFTEKSSSKFSTTGGAEEKQHRQKERSLKKGENNLKKKECELNEVSNDIPSHTKDISDGQPDVNHPQKTVFTEKSSTPVDLEKQQKQKERSLKKWESDLKKKEGELNEVSKELAAARILIERNEYENQQNKRQMKLQQDLITKLQETVNDCHTQPTNFSRPANTSTNFPPNAQRPPPPPFYPPVYPPVYHPMPPPQFVQYVQHPSGPGSGDLQMQLIRSELENLKLQNQLILQQQNHMQGLIQHEPQVPPYRNTWRPYSNPPGNWRPHNTFRPNQENKPYERPEKEKAKPSSLNATNTYKKTPEATKPSFSTRTKEASDKVNTEAVIQHLLSSPLKKAEKPLIQLMNTSPKIKKDQHNQVKQRLKELDNTPTNSDYKLDFLVPGHPLLNRQ